MQKSLWGALLTLPFVILIATVFLSVPAFVHAAPGDANASCTPVYMECGCGMRMTSDGCKKSTNKFMCPCSEVDNGLTVSGVCMGQLKCEGKQGEGLGGGGMEALSQILQQAMQKLMQGGGGGGGMGELPTSTFAGAPACNSYYVVTTPSSDPCAIYSPSPIFDASGGSSGISGSLLDALGSSNTNTNTNTGVSGLLQGNTNTSNTGSQTQVQTNVNTNTNTNAQQSSNSAQLTPGLSGDVRLGGAGATIFANFRQGLSEVASFFGGANSGSSVSVAGRICSSRPWSASFVSNLIPDSFFDGLCEWRGYQVGVALAPQGSGSTSGTGTVTSTTNQRPSLLPTFDSNVPPQADIWAEPASVRLGTRTYIFWNARGVSSCTETGPSFEQRSLSGGASTVPVSGPTTFTIECLTAASTTVRDSVTVQIAI